MKPEREAESAEPILNASQLCRRFTEGERTVEVLRGVNLELAEGERVAIVGRSGSGKSTLLHLLGGLDTPDSGQVVIRGADIFALDDGERSRLRNRRIGFVYQFHHLLAEFTAVENVAMPLYIAGIARTRANAQALALLGEVGLSERATHRPGQLSGGERQRVAIARALVMSPSLVLADEPTGNLDEATAEQVNALILSLSRTHSTAFVVVTHNPVLASIMDRTLHLSGGVLQAAGD